MGKRFYVVLFSALCISLLLLGFSFSKESGSNDIADMIEVKNDDYRVVYSNNQRLDVENNNQVEISIVNKSNKRNNFYLFLSEINEKKYTDVYYSLNDEKEQLLVNGYIDLGELNLFGEDGDYDIYKIKISSKSDSNLEFKLEVKTVDMTLLNNRITISSDVYKDVDGNTRYYGENVNNYIVYNDEVCRIIGIVDNHIRIISNANMLSFYNPINENYATINDYVRSFSSDNNIVAEDIINMNSWLADGKEFWLLENDELYANYASVDYGIDSAAKMSNYYVRNIYELDENVLVISGDGTETNPYEVSYGS